ncbi:MAG TPA: hypothetical protein VHC21_03600 [Candidatus Saccharimonadales bacterium]|nr:hypothetical protein [Candidatus Saccharimonadales bacterium]
MKTIEVIQQELSLEELSRQVRARAAPIRRSTHAGNQSPRELLLQCEAPAGIEIIAVDTIQAADNYSQPRKIRLADSASLPLATNKIGSLIVGKAVVRDDLERHMPHHLSLVCQPRPGESLLAFHQRAIAALNPNNMPTPMTDFFLRSPAIYAAVMAAASETGELSRCVNDQGRIEPCSVAINEAGIHGVRDASPENVGVLPSLNTMMAMDMALSIHLGSNCTIHLAGADMTSYTRDQERMAIVGNLLGRAAALLELRPTAPHQYRVTDITSYSALVLDTEAYASQHQLLLTKKEQSDLLSEEVLA